MSRVRRALAFVGQKLIIAGVNLTQWAGDFPKLGEEPDVDDDGRTYPVEIDDEALQMMLDGQRPNAPPRAKVEEEPPLEGSLRSRRARGAP